MELCTSMRPNEPRGTLVTWKINPYLLLLPTTAANMPYIREVEILNKVISMDLLLLVVLCDLRPTKSQEVSHSVTLSSDALKKFK